MTTALEQPTATAIEQTLIGGDLSKLTTEQRLAYYKQVCESLGLNYLTKPFDYINLNGKLTLYAKRDATDQLRSKKNVSIEITQRTQTADMYVVQARATMPDGRSDESLGAVTLTGLKGEALANAIMKAETKAKRRVTLSICGLGWLDETEVASITSETVLAPQARQIQAPQRKSAPPEPDDPLPNVNTETGEVAVAPEGAVLITSVEARPGTSATGKSYTKFIITADGKTYNTFSATLAKVASDCRDSQTPVVLNYETNKYGNDLSEIVKC
jgi:hypothetical protein